MIKQQRVPSILVGAGIGCLLMLFVAGGRVSWTTALIGAALVGVVEYAFGDRLGAGQQPGQLAGEQHDPTEALPAVAPAAANEAQAAPGWHEAAMTSLPAPAAVAAAKPKFERRPLNDYRSQQDRTAQQCPTCGSHQIVSAGHDFRCQQCAAGWTWQSGDHWPDVRPRPNLQEVARVSETS